MSEKAQVKAPEKSGSVDVVKSGKEVVKRERALWTLERCKKYARRFSDEVTWASGAQSSYKSAMAHGWKELCLIAQKEPKHSHRPAKKAA